MPIVDVLILVITLGVLLGLASLAWSLLGVLARAFRRPRGRPGLGRCPHCGRLRTRQPE